MPWKSLAILHIAVALLGNCGSPAIDRPGTTTDQSCDSRQLALVALDSILSRSPVPVELVAKNDDEDYIGKELSFHLREALTGSNVFQIARSGLRLVLEVHSLDPFQRLTVYADNMTIYSSTVLIHDDSARYFGKSTLGTCGAARTTSCATLMLAELDTMLEEARRQLRDPISVSVLGL